ncbi:MAG: HAMP domain-containing sensor histidine kinase [Buchananella hordeovulneris]|nr:HAMP domain-containing sensor histidine kinase [Buchananella hordeovulneris]
MSNVQGRERLSYYTRLRAAWHSTPLAQRLVILTSALLTLGLAIASMVTVTLLNNHLEGQLDQKLSETAGQVAMRALPLYNQPLPSDFLGDYYVSIKFDGHAPSSFVWSELAKTHGRPQDLNLTYAEAVAHNHENGDLVPVTIATDLPGQTWRGVIIPLKPAYPSQARGVAIVALSTAQLRATVVRTAAVMVVVTTSILLLSVLGASYLVRRALRPLREIEQVAGQIAGGDLAVRIDAEPASTEVGSLASSLNVMLARIEQAFAGEQRLRQQMQQFVSDASHELRTPLATVRGYAELYRMGGIPAEQVPSTMVRIESEAKRMGGLVEDLLQLARIDEGRPLQFSDVDLRRVAARGVEDLRALDPDREVTLLLLPDNAPHLAPGRVADPAQFTHVPAAPHTGQANGTDGGNVVPPNAPAGLLAKADADRITQVVTNLLGNIQRHTPPGSPVEIAVGRRGGMGTIEVRDHGPGIPAAATTKVFERFYRTDTSRARATGGSGLGLAIVSAIMAKHEGTIRVLETPGGGATMRIEVPLSGPKAARERHPASANGAPVPPPAPAAGKATPGA